MSLHSSSGGGGSTQEEQVTASLLRITFSNLILASGPIALLLYLLVKRAGTKRAEARFEQSTRCGKPRLLRYRWPLAFDIIVEAFRMFEDNQILQWFVGIFEETGPTFEKTILGSRSIDTIEPENVESILYTNFSVTDYSLGARREVFAPLLGNGIFTQDSAQWKHSRAMLRPLFSLNHPDTFTQVEEHTEHLLNCIPAGKFVDLQPLFFQFTFDTTTFLLFGTSMNSLQDKSARDGASSREAEFAEAFRVSQDFLFRRGRRGDLYWTVDDKQFRRHCSTVHKFIDEAVQEALSRASGHGKSGSVHSFLDALIEETRDPRVLRDQLLNVMLAGRDTTACCLTWTFRLLAQHPDVLAKLRSEIESTVGVGKNSSSPDRKILKKMKYLNLVLREVLRLYPSVPINSRTALRTTTIPRGGGTDGSEPIMVRKGEAVGFSIHAMHRLKRLYGEDAHSFRPDRWDPDVENAVDLKNIGWGYLPFGGGPRLCLGQEFALFEAGYVTVRVLQKFQTLELDPRDTKIALGTEKQEVTLVLASKDGCRFKVSE
ncbi:hypothetical protein G647_06237 [Cladophialophora carrionii CBS 160.54]|uniref:Cytochrome P450 alkane hydroxylase n=1 Tax=Cladophialophora carrionii CBS 160.54 TaxID=1279043 RepID=V9D5I6_9EURO|nr:uncharacterized protein G647_06237 [Cladophialophora carrionii CBS 160.54]ETI22164.1 hypothetical protein G647_06237 [Cladophialophora carrionii CBS 160.54]